jgi:RNA polymerase-binding transcription factor DksA
MTEPRVVLTPLERLQLRETLQDRWRDQVRLITELSVDLHTVLGNDDDDESDIDAAAVAVAVSHARLRLGEIEQAMRRLDERSFGRCFSCLSPLPLSDLVSEPEARHCADCRRTGSSAGVPAIADVG